MIVTFKRFALAVGVLTLVGCASSPAQHYTLSRTDRPSLQATSMALPPAATSVGAYTLSEISVPAQVDNISLVVRQGDGRLMVLNEDRWSGSLASQLLTAVSQSLTQKLGMPPIQKLVAEAASSSVTRIQLDVQRFDLIPGQSVSLDAVWSVRFPGSRTFLTCYTRLEQNVGIGVLALVQGQQNNVEALAAQLAQALMSRQAPAGSQCTR
ncbi:MAG: PqiC family protein [Burkholderiales bacterium]|jgi:uncharacterized protein|nr:PqiC family protein [Burkholderiales bacterium]MDP4909072.1 PqiC family protein [Burkholderiaceae bacterium]